MEQGTAQQPDPANPGNFEMNEEQWNFVFKYYPEYGAGPYDLMVWLYNQALQSEQQNQSDYGKPSVIGGRGTGQEDEKEDFDSIMGSKAGQKLDKLGKQGKGQMNKEQQRLLE